MTLLTLYHQGVEVAIIPILPGADLSSDNACAADQAAYTSLLACTDNGMTYASSLSCNATTGVALTSVLACDANAPVFTSSLACGDAPVVSTITSDLACGAVAVYSETITVTRQGRFFLL